jgi:amino acid adenylation domain-containing protein
MPTETLSGFRLSPQQERLWHLQQTGFAYGAFCAVEIEGALDINDLKAAVQDSVNCHDSLRSHFHRLPGMKTPVMVIAERCVPQWEEMDWTELNTQAQSIQLVELLKTAQYPSEDLSQSPLLQIKLLQLASERYLLVLRMPALCLDAWSLRVLVREIGDRYGASTPLTPAEEAVQYVQFSEWQHQLLIEDESQAGRAYWNTIPLSKLTGLKLPFEDRSKQDSNFCIEAWRIEIPVAAIQDFAQQQNTSIHDLLLACWTILMGRLTDEPNLVMGYGCDRRTYPELHNVLGLLATWLPLHCPLTPDLHFTEVLTLLAEKCRVAEEWQDYFVGNTDASKPFFFPVGFEFASSPIPWTVKNLSWKLLQHHACIERFKLKLTCTQQSDTVDMAFYYDASRFTNEAVQAIAQQFQALLADAIAHPQQPISTLNLLSAEEREALFLACDPPQESYCIHHLFEAKVEQYPQAIALVYEDQQLTYAELNRQANQLAHYLQNLGVGSETIVGIYLERSLQSIVALLAVLKTGGAYLPLDPALPAAAIAARLHLAQANWMITEQALVDALSRLKPGGKFICLDRDGEAIAQEVECNLAEAATPEDLMYVLFTSGTTGQPKGVAVEHRQLHSYLCGILEQLDLPSGSSFATVSTLAADLGNTAVFPALCTGGCLHLIAPDRLSNPEALGTYLQQHKIDCLKIVPSHLQALLNTAHPAQLLPQRCLVLGGEALSWQFVAQLLALKPDCRILNHYGPTETTVGVLTYTVPPHAVDADSWCVAIAPDEIVPLGYPLAHTRMYILDRHQQPVPKGLPGELYIGGATVSRGYLHQPELTAERFISHPFGAQSDQRLYKTGDRVRYLADGSLLFLGRLDRQVKIRGYRVELAEIESVFSQHSEIRQVVVTAPADQSGLVAYIVPHLLQPLNEVELKQFLRQRLPEYMVPATFVFLKVLPLTGNGKVDVQALPTPAERQPSHALTYTPPSTETEQAIAEIWQAALGLKSVGLQDNFFDLGGHSLLMVRVHSKLQAQFQKDLAMGDLFRYPTIQSLANYLNPTQSASPPNTPSLQRSLDRAETRKAIANQRRQTQEVQDAGQ